MKNTLLRSVEWSAPPTGTVTSIYRSAEWNTKANNRSAYRNPIRIWGVSAFLLGKAIEHSNLNHLLCANLPEGQYPF